MLSNRAQNRHGNKSLNVESVSNIGFRKVRQNGVIGVILFLWGDKWGDKWGDFLCKLIGCNELCIFDFRNGTSDIRHGLGFETMRIMVRTVVQRR